MCLLVLAVKGTDNSEHGEHHEINLIRYAYLILLTDITESWFSVNKCIGIYDDDSIGLSSTLWMIRRRSICAVVVCDVKTSIRKHKL